MLKILATMLTGVSTLMLAQAPSKVTLGGPAPAFKVSRWVKGAPVPTLEKGKVYVVEFWATWCGPCKEAIPHVSGLARTYAGKATFIGVDVWETGEAAVMDPKVDAFVKSMGDKMTYSVARDTADEFMGTAWLKAAGLSGIPNAFIVDALGRVAWIGHPAALDKPLAAILEGTYDIASQADWDRFQGDLKAINADPVPKDKDYPELEMAYRLPKFLDRCERYFLEHPKDPRRWDAVIGFHSSIIQSIRGLNAPSIRAKVDAIFPEASRQAYMKKGSDMVKLGLATKDLPENCRRYFETVKLVEIANTAGEVMGAGRIPDLKPLRAELGALLPRLAQSSAVIQAAGIYMELLEQSTAPRTKVMEEWEYFKKLPMMQQQAEAQLTIGAYYFKPLPMAFTAVDGRKVDLKDLRGKVVLIDFWGVWAGPCRDEIPNIKKVYDAYHEKGFEVVGITCELAEYLKTDTQEQKDQKFSEEKKKLEAFLAKEGIKWPNHFDGLDWGSPFIQQLEIQKLGVPKALLLDREGKLITPEAVGPRLELEVKKALGL